jgi:DNA repair ATPase RecN
MHILGSAVTGDDDLSVVAVELVEGVKETLQRLSLVQQKMDIIEQKDMDVSESGTELVHLLFSHRQYEVISELLCSNVGCLQPIVCR